MSSSDICPLTIAQPNQTVLPCAPHTHTHQFVSFARAFFALFLRGKTLNETTHFAAVMALPGANEMTPPCQRRDHPVPLSETGNTVESPRFSLAVLGSDWPLAKNPSKKTRCVGWAHRPTRWCGECQTKSLGGTHQQVWQIVFARK